MPPAWQEYEEKLVELEELKKNYRTTRLFWLASVIVTILFFAIIVLLKNKLEQNQADLYAHREHSVEVHRILANAVEQLQNRMEAVESLSAVSVDTMAKLEESQSEILSAIEKILMGNDFTTDALHSTMGRLRNLIRSLKHLKVLPPDGEFDPNANNSL